MKMIVLTITIILPIAASAGRLVNMPDGSTCIVSNDGDVILSCSGGDYDRDDSYPGRGAYQQRDPGSCEELRIAIRHLENQARRASSSDYRRATEQRRRYEDIYRDECR